MRAAAILFCVLLCMPTGCQNPTETPSVQLPDNIAAQFTDSAAQPHKADDAAWWGGYASDSAALEISNYNGKSFLFSFSLDQEQEVMFGGVAAVDPTNLFLAGYMDLAFALSSDAQTVAVTQREDRPDKAQRAAFAGVYGRS